MTAKNSSESKPPFFIVGCPRTGTTLLHVLLDSHPRIAIPPESHLFVHFREIFDCYGDLAEESNLRLFVKDLLSDERIRKWGLEITVSDFVRQLPTRSIQDVVSLLFELYMKQKGKVRWGDKTPDHILEMDTILKIFPDAKLIHVVRDGRDVAVSLKRVFFGPTMVNKAAELWRRYLSIFQEFKKRVSPDQYLEVYYERLVSDPGSELRRILEFLQEELVTYGNQVPDTELRRCYLESNESPVHQSLMAPITAHKIGIFKTQLSARHMEIFESMAGDILRSYLHWKEDLLYGRDFEEAWEELNKFLLHHEEPLYRKPSAEPLRGYAQRDRSYTTYRTYTRPENAQPPRRDPQEHLRKDYENLEVAFKSDFETVKKQYKSLLRKYHPDRFDQDPEKYRPATEVTKKLNESFNRIKEYHEHRS
ncbi:MAG: sulfotransferase [Candidatus Omnitrophica bacterium]|nr:sulfotransferase [Candidatus Omnitrophota bacterium]